MIKSLALVGILLAACAVEPDQATSSSEQLDSAPENQLVEAGTGLVLLEVTDDNFAIYQAGQQVFAAQLVAGATPRLIADVPAGNIAFAYRVGSVVFCWTNPDRTLPSFGVSPLVIWSARTGAHLASQQSAVGTFATSTTPDGRFVVFPGNSSADGTTGELDFASTDLHDQATLLPNIDMGFAGGPCRPQLTFVGGDHASLVAAYCVAGAATATLSKWSTDRTRRDLLTNLRTPALLSADADSEELFTITAAHTPMIVDADGTARVVANVSASSGFIGQDDAAYFITRDAAGVASQSRAAEGHAPQVIIHPLLGFQQFQFGSRAIASPPTSPDGHSVLYFDAFDPNTGLTDLLLTQERSPSTPIVIDAQQRDALFGVAFTADSSHVLYTAADVNTGLGPFFAADGRSAPRQFSDAAGWSWDAAIGGIVTFNDHTTLDPNNVGILSTADLRAVDVTRTTLAPKLIATQANVNYFASYDHTAVAYTVDHGPQPGLYVARVK